MASPKFRISFPTITLHWLPPLGLFLMSGAFSLLYLFSVQSPKPLITSYLLMAAKSVS